MENLLKIQLEALHASTTDIFSTFVFTIDGTIIFSSIPDEGISSSIGTIFAALHSIGGQASQHLKIGQAKQIHIQTDDNHYLIFAKIDSEHFLAIQSNANADNYKINDNIGQYLSAITVALRGTNHE